MWTRNRQVCKLRTSIDKVLFLDMGPICWTHLTQQQLPIIYTHHKLESYGRNEGRNMADTFINQNLKLGDTVFHCNKIGDFAMQGRKFQLNIAPCVFNHEVTKCKVEWRYRLDIWREVSGQLHVPAVLHLAKNSQCPLDKRLCWPESLSRQCTGYKSLVSTWIEIPIVFTSRS